MSQNPEAKEWIEWLAIQIANIVSPSFKMSDKQKAEFFAKPAEALYRAMVEKKLGTGKDFPAKPHNDAEKKLVGVLPRIHVPLPPLEGEKK